MEVIDKLFPDAKVEVMKINDSTYSISLHYPGSTSVYGTLTLKGNEMLFDVRRIKLGETEYIISKPLYKRSIFESVNMIDDYLMVTNIRVNTQNKKVAYEPSYRVNLEYLLSIPLRSTVTPVREVYVELSLFKKTARESYITLENKIEKYAGRKLTDVEKTVMIYSLTHNVPTLEYHDTIKSIEFDNVNATVGGSGALHSIINYLKRLIKNNTNDNSV